MNFKLHYTKNGYEDSLILSGETLDEIHKELSIEIEKRKLDKDKNNLWNEKLEDNPTSQGSSNWGA